MQLVFTGQQVLRPLGHQQITNLAAAVGLTIPAGCCMVLITVTTQAVRWRDDGTDPTATIGMPLAVNTELQYHATGLTALKFIEQVAGGVLNAAYYG